MVVLSEPECKCYYNELRSLEDRDTLLGCVYIKVLWCFVFCYSRNCLSVASRISNCKDTFCCQETQLPKSAVVSLFVCFGSLISNFYLRLFKVQ